MKVKIKASKTAKKLLSAMKAEKPVLGVILESENDRSAEGLIRAVTD